MDVHLLTSRETNDSSSHVRRSLCHGLKCSAQSWLKPTTQALIFFFWTIHYPRLCIKNLTSCWSDPNSPLWLPYPVKGLSSHPVTQLKTPALFRWPAPALSPSRAHLQQSSSPAAAQGRTVSSGNVCGVRGNISFMLCSFCSCWGSIPIPP